MNPQQALRVAGEAGFSERLLRYQTVCGPRGRCRREPLTDGGPWTFCPDCLTVYDHHGASINQIPELRRNVDESLGLEERGERRALSASPIYTRSADHGLQGVGTAIFVSHEGHSFVATASHVLSEYMDTAELLTGGTSVVRVNQRFFVSPDEDQYDVGFVPLAEEQCQILSDVVFLTVDDMDLSADLSQGLHYVVGYRADDNAQEIAAQQVNAGWSVYGVRSAPEDVYEQRRLFDSDKLLLMFDRGRLHGPSGPVEQESPPEGLSGAGVWRIHAQDDLSSNRLTGIVESQTDSGKLIYAARLNRLMSALAGYAARPIS
jgi:hypothetical protein